MGHLGGDPESAATQSNQLVAKMSVATSYVRQDKVSGQKIEKTDWHRVVAFDRKAEIMTQYLRKGSAVFVEGRLNTRTFQNDQGQNVKIVEIVADKILLLDPPPDQQQGYQAPNPQQGYQQQAPQQQPQQPPQPDYSDDIPF